MRIEGHFQGGGKFTPSPYITALVVLSSGVFAPVNFLVDTGAFRTTLHPSDAQKLGIRALPLGDPKNQESTGIGGNAQYSPPPAQPYCLRPGRKNTHGKASFRSAHAAMNRFNKPCARTFHRFLAEIFSTATVLSLTTARMSYI